MPSGTANKPGDVVRAANGKTIEILNTDAEGRLVLADCLDLARKRGATRLIDVATLTGAMWWRSGPCHGRDGRAAGLGGRSVRAAGRPASAPGNCRSTRSIRTDQKPIADVANTGGRQAGTITAALFLQHFVGTTPWAHLDIAGTGWNEKDVPYLAKGADRLRRAHFVGDRPRAAQAKWQARRFTWRRPSRPRGARHLPASPRNSQVQ